jgi:hypothetical protein
VFFCATITLGGFWRSSRNGYKDCTSDGPTIAVNTVAGLAADHRIPFGGLDLCVGSLLASIRKHDQALGSSRS